MRMRSRYARLFALVAVFFVGGCHLEEDGFGSWFDRFDEIHDVIVDLDV